MSSTNQPTRRLLFLGGRARRESVLWSWTIVVTLILVALGLGGVPAAEAEPGSTAGSNYQATDAAIVAPPVRSPGTGQQFYFAMTDRFSDGDPGNNTGGLGSDRLVSGYDPTDANYYHGGDIAGIQKKLDYIAGLGTTAIWVTPPMKNDPIMRFGDVGIASYHGYWTLDLTTIDPHLGTERAMRRFIAAAHQHGIKIYFDIEINTTADVIQYADANYDYVPLAEKPYVDRHGQIVDIAALAGMPTFPRLDAKTSFPHRPVVPPEKRNAKKPHWLNDPALYHNRGNSTFEGESVTYGDFVGLDDLMTENPRVVRGFIDVYKRWVDFGVDGFRIDTVKHVNFAFWQTWSKAIMEHAHKIGNDDFFMFGEVLDGEQQKIAPYVRNTDIGGVLDFPFAWNAQDFATGEDVSGLSEFFAKDDIYVTPHSSAHDLETFVSNHDLGRLGHALAGADHQLMRDQLGQDLMLLSRGQPVLYYGDEQGFTGGGDLATDVAGRQDMFATKVEAYAEQSLVDGSPAGTGDHFDTKSHLYQHIAALGDVRSRHPGLVTGAQIERYADKGPGVYAFSRVDRDERIEYLVALNNATSDRRVTFTTLTPGANYSILVGESVEVQADDTGSITITVPALSSLVLQADRQVAAPAKPQQTELTSPAPGADLSGLAPVEAEISPDYWQETSFAWRKTGDTAWISLGTNDTGHPGVRHDVSKLKTGTRIEYRAVTVDAVGHRSAASSSGVVR